MDELKPEAEPSEEGGRTKEEILEMSRKENENGDEREKQYYVKANSFAFSIGLLVAGIIILVTVITSGRCPAEILLITCAMQAVQSFVVALGNRKMKKLYLTIGIVECVLAVFFLVFWILQLCGVA